ncbi:16S rRNA (uracil(1498)-N(3))-methyltransferase [Sphingosinicella soli]|uniref:Ribosomal RNA small subunit methyltransferase E n=1 Tax=Sphingosinicella soli TaxID=333708 RepID=A0A7W7F5D9_9SPHN|nr:16S rRNA (uracil(1498)-N(3))-methyltransferase [Sphingosinicella soli]MBB4631310.1 16S rRNA (uracil1498-N3)-methyltransferase [Sphingosinicella soli]
MSSKAGPRLFVDTPLAAGRTLPLPPPAGHYLTRVMRLREGDGVRLFDDRTGEWRAVIAAVGKREVVVRAEALLKPRETVPDLWLCAAPLKAGRIDWLAEKACELGVARLVPTVTRRTVVGNLKLDRLRAHMVEAAEQCERTALPELAEPVSLATLLEGWPEDRKLIFCDEEGGEPIAQALPGIAAPAAILIGPEGGFDDAERAAVRALPQCVRVSLGPRILRADTAAAAAISVWQAMSGDWQGA